MLCRIEKRSRIVHLIASNFFGGPERQIVEHLARVNKKRFTCMLASFLEGSRHSEVLQRAEAVGLQCHGIPMSRSLDFGAFFGLLRLLREGRFDLLCTHGYKSTVMGWWAGRKVGIPVIAFSRGYTAENVKVALYEWIERRVLQRLNGVICVCEAQRRRLNNWGICNTKTWVVHNAVRVNGGSKETDRNPREGALRKLGLPKNSKMVVSAGRFSPEKGHRLLIKAISMLGPKANGTQFVICGEGPCEKELKTEARKLKIADRCHFVGFRRDLDEIFRAMDFLVLPSLTEGLPNVVLEAFANKKPVVATSVGGVPEIVRDGVNGILVPHSRSDLLAEGIEKLLASPRLRRKMGEVGYQKVKTTFSFERQNKELEDIYQLILNSPCRFAADMTEHPSNDIFTNNYLDVV